MSAALKQALAATLGTDVVQQIDARSEPVAYFDLWANNRRRKGINPRTNKEYNDSHIQGRMTMPIARLRQVLAEAEAKGHPNIQVWCDLWLQHNGTGTGAMMTGAARNVVPDEKRFVPTPQNQEATPPADETSAPPADGNEESATDDTVSG